MSSSENFQEYDRPFFDQKLLRQITATPGQCIVDTLHPTREGWGGFPMVMDCYHHIPKEEYEERASTAPSAKPWQKGMIVNPIGDGGATDDGDYTQPVHPSEVDDPVAAPCTQSAGPTATWVEFAKQAERLYERVLKAGTTRPQ